MTSVKSLSRRKHVICEARPWESHLGPCVFRIHRLNLPTDNKTTST